MLASEAGMEIYKFTKYDKEKRKNIINIKKSLKIIVTTLKNNYLMRNIPLHLII